MANTSPIFIKNVTAKGTTWTNSDSANTKKTISPTIGSEGTRIHSINITTDDTTTRDFGIYLNDGSTDFLVATIAISAGSGASSTAIAVLASISSLVPMAATDGSILLPAGWQMKGAVVTQPTSAKTFWVVVTGGDY